MSDLNIPQKINAFKLSKDQIESINAISKSIAENDRKIIESMDALYRDKLTLIENKTKLIETIAQSCGANLSTEKWVIDFQKNIIMRVDEITEETK